MKNFVVLTFVALCLMASSHGFALQGSSNGSVETIVDTKKELLSGAKGVIVDLKQSALSKKQELVGSVKAAAGAKLSYAGRIMNAKLSLLKDAAAKKSAKYAAMKTAIQTRKAQFVSAVAAIIAKTHGLFLKHTMPIKEKALYLYNGSVDKINTGIAKKLEFLTSLKAFKTPATTPAIATSSANDLVPVTQAPAPAVESTASVSETVDGVYVNGPQADIYGPPADTYRSLVDSFVD